MASYPVRRSCPHGASRACTRHVQTPHRWDTIPTGQEVVRLLGDLVSVATSSFKGTVSAHSSPPKQKVTGYLGSPKLIRRSESCEWVRFFKALS